MTTDEALAHINEDLSLDLGCTIKGDELKGYRRDDEGGTSKFYLNAADCTALAEAFAVVAAALAARTPERTP